MAYRSYLLRRRSDPRSGSEEACSAVPRNTARGGVTGDGGRGQKRDGNQPEDRLVPVGYLRRRAAERGRGSGRRAPMGAPPVWRGDNGGGGWWRAKELKEGGKTAKPGARHQREREDAAPNRQLIRVERERRTGRGDGSTEHGSGGRWQRPWRGPGDGGTRASTPAARARREWWWGGWGYFSRVSGGVGGSADLIISDVGRPGCCFVAAFFLQMGSGWGGRGCVLVLDGAEKLLSGLTSFADRRPGVWR